MGSICTYQKEHAKSQQSQPNKIQFHKAQENFSFSCTNARLKSLKADLLVLFVNAEEEDIVNGCAPHFNQFDASQKKEINETINRNKEKFSQDGQFIYENKVKDLPFNRIGVVLYDQSITRKQFEKRVKNLFKEIEYLQIESIVIAEFNDGLKIPTEDTLNILIKNIVGMDHEITENIVIRCADKQSFHKITKHISRAKNLKKYC